MVSYLNQVVKKSDQKQEIPGNRPTGRRSPRVAAQVRVLPVAAAAGEEYDDWDAADAPAADVAAVSEKKKEGE